MTRGKIFFFSGPSGVGKGTLIHALRERHPDWVFPPSFTTRQPRPDEVDGETYHFISREEFHQKIADGDFLEYAVVHGGNLYGTDRHKLLAPLAEGKVVIREFDVQGFLSVKDRLPREDYHSLFIRPTGGVQELIRRIEQRAPISKEELEHRVESMGKEFQQAHLYDGTIISIDGEIEKMITDAEAVITEVLAK